MSISAILLAGGVGSRMGTDIPKQFLKLKGKPIFCYSLELFLSIESIKEVIVVVEPEYRELFNSVKFALPGKLRQDSVKNGLAQVSGSAEYVCIHDVARPLVERSTVLEVLHQASIYGAAVAAVPMKSTVKEGADGFVSKTLDRSTLWEIQTPQVMKKSYLEEGFQHAEKHALTVTDDVSLVELLGKEVKLVKAHDNNIKITTPVDLSLAEVLLNAQL